MLRNRHEPSCTVGVCLAEQGIALARVRPGHDAVGVDRFDFRPLAGGETQTAALRKLVIEHGVAGARCVCVLPPGRYQLNQVEAPAVEPDELRAALRWRLKDLIDYPVEEATVDAFEVPPPRAATARKMLFAVSARQGLLQQAAAAVRGAGLRLAAIDIPELALRNLALQVPEQGGGVALVALGSHSGLITISRDDTLFLARNLDFGLEQLAASRAVLYENLVLEIQRSLDYYESQLAPAPASRILVAPMSEGRDGLLDYLNSQMGVAAYGLDCAQIVDLERPAPEALQAQALLALGGALRSEAAA